MRIILLTGRIADQDLDQDRAIVAQDHVTVVVGPAIVVPDLVPVPVLVHHLVLEIRRRVDLVPNLVITIVISGVINHHLEIDRPLSHDPRPDLRLGNISAVVDLKFVVVAFFFNLPLCYCFSSSF